MNVGSKGFDEAQPAAASRRGFANRRLIHLIVLIAVVVVLASAALVISAWVPLLPRGVRRGLTEGLLRAVLAGYVALFVVSVVAEPAMALLLFQSRRARRRRPIMARAVLLGGSCLMSLVVLEMGSAGWRMWMHRYPKLPTRFPGQRQTTRSGLWFWGARVRSVNRIARGFRSGRSWPGGWAKPCQSAGSSARSWRGWATRSRTSIASSRRSNSGRTWSSSTPATTNSLRVLKRSAKGGWMRSRATAGSEWSTGRACIRHSAGLRMRRSARIGWTSGPRMRGRHTLIDSPQCSAAEAEEIGRDFEARLEAITAYCEQIGSVPVLIIPPANEADYEPSRSTLPANVSQEERTMLEREWSAIRGGKATDALVTADRYRRILDRHPGFAEAHFCLARLLEAAGHRAAAAEHYLAALENDGLPVRCPARLRAL